MKPLVLAGAVIGVQYLVESNGGWSSIVGLFGGAGAATSAGAAASSGDGTTPLGATPNVSQPGNTAAVAHMVGLGSIAGIPLPPIDASNPNNASMSAIWASIQPQVSYSTDGRALATAFLGAYDAARKADPVNYNPFQTDGQGSLSFVQSLGFVMAPCNASTGLTRNSLGDAGCALAAARDAYGSGNSILAAFGGLNSGQVGSIDNQSIVAAIATLTSEMDAVGFTAQGIAPSDQPCASPPCWTWGNINGAVQYSLAKTTQAVVGGAVNAASTVLGDAATTAFQSLVGSNYVWAAAFALLAWKVLT